VDEVAVSSTKIRQALEAGDVSLANRYLGYPYMLTGTVVHGDKLGRMIGFPTANIRVEEEYKLIPGNGVYAVQVSVKDNHFFGMMNIGFRPTVNGLDKRLEVNVFDFEGDLYEQKISIYFLDYIRKEAKFASIDALQAQLARDEQAIRKALLANDLKRTG
jgi:riboflavin kinase/FMN adenylyltransferase